MEALLAIIILLFPIIVFSTTPTEFDNKKDNIYKGLDFLEKENKLIDNSDALIINNILGLNVSVSKCSDKRIVNYLVISGIEDFRIIKIYY